MLHGLVLVLAVWYALWSAILLPLYPNFWPRLSSAILFESGPVAGLVLLRRGHFRRASLAYLGLTWLATTIRTAMGSGIYSTAAEFYIALPIMGTWLLGFQAALYIAAVCLVTTLCFAVLEIAGIQPAHPVPVAPLAVWATLVQVILIAAIPIGQILRALRDALAQSRRAEAELQRYEKHLEELVQERTAQLVEARNQAEAANRAKTVFLANVSHELRTPLSAILGFSALVRSDPTLPEQHRKDLAIVGNSGEHLLGLIDDVLDTAKIEAGGVGPESAVMDFHAMVHDTIRMMRERAERRGLELQVEICSRVPRYVRSDPRKLRQILTNLTANAVKYTEQGSVFVRVDAGTEGGRPVLLMEVADTGVGIAPADHTRIFEPFVQAGNAAGRSGTGLGLSISRNFVEFLGGAIRLESTPGRGSKFHVTVPLEIAEASEAPEAAAGREVAGIEDGQPDYRILVVEDGRENRMLLRRLLESVGFRVETAGDGAEAIEMFSRRAPDFIWMDLFLPVLGGIEATRRIRELPGGRDVRIVALTASACASQRAVVLAAGFDDFLRKPYRAREIFECMGRHLGVRYLYREAEPAADMPPQNLQSEEVAALPAGLRQDLEAAILSLEATRIAREIGRVSEWNAVLGSAMSRLAGEFAYGPILAALEKCQSRVAQARY